MDEQDATVETPEQHGLNRRQMLAVTGSMAGVVALGTGLPAAAVARERPRSGARRGRDWLAGDHHVHSEWSGGWEDGDASRGTPPDFVRGGDAIYPITRNAQQGRRYGLQWMVTTDHGGPNHSKINRDQAYPELMAAREAVPEVLHFYGMEFDTPAADHSSLIIPRVARERDLLFELESRFSKRDEWFPASSSGVNPARDTEGKMIEALNYMRTLQDKPLVIAHHPSRSATGLGVYGQDHPQEFRAWNDTAPDIAVGFEGSPGHQAAALHPDGTLDPTGARGSYGNYPTHGGYDQMTAVLGGLWDSLLGEGRRWWITATSDSHVNWRDRGADFWPGEYSKTYVLAARDYADIFDGVRNGRMFVTTGDLIDRLDLTVRRASSGTGRPQGGPNEAGSGETLLLRGSGDRSVDVEVRIRVPKAANGVGDRPMPQRLDIIAGRVSGRQADRTADKNPTTQVIGRYDFATDMRRDGEDYVVTHRIPDVDGPMYVRVRGTNTAELEPQPDPKGENPWTDLWFYSNPVFITR